MLLVAASGIFFTLMMMAYKRQQSLKAKAVAVRNEHLRRKQMQQQRPY